jgi:uncharacterized membrane protein (UPF0127 family)
MRLLLAALAIALNLALAAQAAGADLPVRSLAIGKHKLVAEVAATPDQRSTGLMHRFSLRPDHGMLFVFERPDRLSFWMRNTYIPLSIAFIGPDGKIVNIEDMAPQTETSHWSRGPAQYALEMRKGWFAERGIREGDAVEGLPGKIGAR